MGLVFRQTVKSTLLMGVGAALGAALVLLQTKLMSPTEYGFSRLVTNVSVTAAILLSFGVPNTVSVYIHEYADQKDKRASLLFISALYPLLLFLVCLIPFLAFKEEIAASFQKASDAALFLKYFWTIPLYAFGFVLVLVLEQVLLANHKTALNTSLKEVLFRIFNIALVLLYAYALISFQIFIWGWSIAVVVLAVLVILLARAKKLLPFYFKKGVFSKAEWREFFKFSAFHLLLNFSLTLLGYMDSIMLAPLDKNGLVSVAVYANAVFIVSLMTIAYRPMILTAYPALAKAYQQKNVAGYTSLFTRSSLNIQIVATLMLLLLLCNADNAVRIMGANYTAVASLAVILAIGRFVDMVTGLNDSMLSFSKHYTYFFYFTAGIVLMLLVLYYYSIPRYGIYGAAWSTTFVLVLYNFIKWWLLKKKMQLNPFSKGSLQIFLLGLLSFLAVYFIPYLGNKWADIMVRSLMILVLFTAGILWLKPSPDVVAYLAQVKEQKRLF